jgi:hypothetical protein
MVRVYEMYRRSSRECLCHHERHVWRVTIYRFLLLHTAFIAA